LSRKADKTPRLDRSGTFWHKINLNTTAHQGNVTWVPQNSNQGWFVGNPLFTTMPLLSLSSQELLTQGDRHNVTAHWKTTDQTHMDLGSTLVWSPPDG
jgi:hypothetical protein